MEILKVLVVDDEARMRKLVRDFLTVKGFLVVEAGVSYRITCNNGNQRTLINP